MEDLKKKILSDASNGYFDSFKNYLNQKKLETDENVKKHLGAAYLDPDKFVDRAGESVDLPIPVGSIGKAALKTEMKDAVRQLGNRLKGIATESVEEVVPTFHRAFDESAKISQDALERLTADLRNVEKQITSKMDNPTIERLKELPAGEKIKALSENKEFKDWYLKALQEKRRAQTGAISVGGMGDIIKGKVNVK